MSYTNIMNKLDKISKKSGEILVSKLKPTESVSNAATIEANRKKIAQRKQKRASIKGENNKELDPEPEQVLEDDSTSKISSAMTLSMYPSNCADDDDDSTDSVGTSLTTETSLANVPDIRDVIFTTKEKYYFKTIDKFYRKNPNANIKVMVDIIEGNSHVSLRLIEWFITRYAYRKKISYSLKNDEDVYKFKFPVHISYKSQLKAYKKRYFDPFRRKKKFMYSYYEGEIKKKLLTTICQLNFFLWAFDNGVIDYIFKHYDEINRAMLRSNKDEKKNKTKTAQTDTKQTKAQASKDSPDKKTEKDVLCTTLEFD